MLSITYRGIGIPLFWVVLNLEGNSCVEDRIGLLKRVVERLGISRIEVLLADREFIGTQWFRFLIEQKIPFIIRVKQNSIALDFVTPSNRIKRMNGSGNSSSRLLPKSNKPPLVG